jgi:hypothetical protein
MRPAYALSVALLACQSAAAPTPAPPTQSTLTTAPSPSDAGGAPAPIDASGVDATTTELTPTAEECERFPDSETCVWKREDKASSNADSIVGVDPEKSRALLTAQHAKVMACVARVTEGNALSEELSHRVRLRLKLKTNGTIESLLFQTANQGYGYIDKSSHICIANALKDLRFPLQPSPTPPRSVTFTFKSAH